MVIVRNLYGPRSPRRFSWQHGLVCRRPSPTPARAQTRSNTLRFIPSTPLPSLDSIVATSYIICNHGCLIYDTLFATDVAFCIRPQMVEAWDTASDGLKWKFQLRDGLVLHDGAALRAQD